MEWYELYREFSKYLVEMYEEYGDKAGKRLYSSYKKRDPQLKILPWVRNLKKHGIYFIDPLHIFASFNYYKISASTREERMILFCELLVDNKIAINDLKYVIGKINNLDVFKDFPHINITHTVGARNNETQREIWKLFSLAHKNDKINIHKYFDKYEEWYGIDIPSLTIFMFWVNSDNFLPLDKNTTALLKENEVINTFPENYGQYLKLIQGDNTSLYRSLAKVAIDKKAKLQLKENEKKELEDFLQTKSLKYSKLSKEKYKQDKLDIELIPEFNFEMYVIINGIARRIICRNDKIKEYVHVKIKVEDETKDKYDFTYPNFQIIALKVCKSHYINGLSSKRFYYFTQNFEIKDGVVVLKNTDALKLYSGYEINNINITAIVGKNGTGKSTIAELLIMAINNFTYLLQNNSNYELDELKDLFYTIYTNYSLHALNERHYEDKSWIRKSFHKIDGLPAPVLIEPYRKEGIIDVNNLESLTKQRLLATILKKSMDNKDFTVLTEGRRATHLDISIDDEKLRDMLLIITTGDTDEDSNNGSLIIDDIYTVLNYKKHKKILKYFLPNFDIPTKPKHPSIVFKKIKRHSDAALKYRVGVYLCYKIKEINERYHNKQKIDELYLNKLLNDKSHITFKLHQAINYIKFNTVRKMGKKNINELSEHINTIMQNHNIGSIMEVLPPSFFKVDIIINDNIPFSKLSSGEKQEIYATSSIVYHLQNIESVHQGDSDRIAYSYVNIILDEIELYFHPDMQRKFIYNLLQAIENKGGFNHIVGLNIMMITHSPFILSDILKENILYLDEDSAKKDTGKLGDTFAANIHTLLDNSFFMDDGLMGKFAKEKISKIIKELNKLYDKSKGEEENEINAIEEVSISRREEMKRIIENIGEPFLRRKLSDMYIKVFEPKKTRLEILEDERKRLDKQIKRLKND